MQSSQCLPPSPLPPQTSVTVYECHCQHGEATSLHTTSNGFRSRPLSAWRACMVMTRDPGTASLQRLPLASSLPAACVVAPTLHACRRFGAVCAWEGVNEGNLNQKVQATPGDGASGPTGPPFFCQRRRTFAGIKITTEPAAAEDEGRRFSTLPVATPAGAPAQPGKEAWVARLPFSGRPTGHDLLLPPPKPLSREGRKRISRRRQQQQPKRTCIFLGELPLLLPPPPILLARAAYGGQQHPRHTHPALPHCEEAANSPPTAPQQVRPGGSGRTERGRRRHLFSLALSTSTRAPERDASLSTGTDWGTDVSLCEPVSGRGEERSRRHPGGSAITERPPNSHPLRAPDWDQGGPSARPGAARLRAPVTPPQLRPREGRGGRLRSANPRLQRGAATSQDSKARRRKTPTNFVRHPAGLPCRAGGSFARFPTVSRLLAAPLSASVSFEIEIPWPRPSAQPQP